jgi:hypothetical protein
MMNNDEIFGVIIFVGLIWLILTTVKLSGTKNDDEFKSTKKD